LFGGSTPEPGPQPGPPPPPAPRPRQTLSSATNSTLNQLTLVRDTWALPPKEALANVQITITATTSAQLQDILKKLPDGLTVALSLEKDAE